MLTFIYALVIVAAILFAAGAFAHFVRKHEGAVWWRGSMGLLAFAATLLLIEIYLQLGGTR